METGEAILAEMREQTRLLKILVGEELPRPLFDGSRTMTGPAVSDDFIERVEDDITRHMDGVNGAYRHYINPRAKESLTDKAQQKLRARLKRYTWEELTVAIHNFSQDEWNMKNNRHRGLAWFMNGDDRIEEFLNLDLKTVAEAAEKAHACPKCGSDKYAFRGTVFQCDSCGHTRVGNQKDADKRHQDLGNGMGMLPAGGRVADGRLGGTAPQPQRRLADPSQAVNRAAGQGALPSAVQDPGSAGSGDHYPETPLRLC